MVVEAGFCTFNSKIFSCYDKFFPQLSLCCLGCSSPYVIFSVIISTLFDVLSQSYFSTLCSCWCSVCPWEQTCCFLAFYMALLTQKIIFKNMWRRRKISLPFNLVLLVFLAWTDIPETLKIICFFMLPCQLWNDLPFPLWKKQPNLSRLF